MESVTLRALIRDKLADGRLPHDHIPRLWGGPGAGETCDACEEKITALGLVMEGIAIDGHKPLQLHVECFYLWDAERRDAEGVVEDGPG